MRPYLLRMYTFYMHVKQIPVIVLKAVNKILKKKKHNKNRINYFSVQFEQILQYIKLFEEAVKVHNIMKGGIKC